MKTLHPTRRSSRIALSIAAFAAAACGSFASATEQNYHFCFDDVILSGGQTTSLKFDTLSGTLSGFSIEFTFNKLESTFSWASDGAFVLSDGSQWGGFQGLFGPVDGLWSFNGAGSAPNGTYSDFKTNFDGVNQIVYVEGNSYTFTFGNDWADSGPVAYSDVCVTLYGVIPAPGAVALLGLGGLVGCRRRKA